MFPTETFFLETVKVKQSKYSSSDCEWYIMKELKADGGHEQGAIIYLLLQMLHSCFTLHLVPECIKFTATNSSVRFYLQTKASCPKCYK